MSEETATLPKQDHAQMTRREVAVGYLWNTVFSIISRVVFPILTVLLLYRKLGPAEIGIFALIIPIFQIIETIRDAGLAVTYIADREIDSEREGAYVTLGLISAVFFASLIFLCRNLLASLLHTEQLAWGLPIVALAMVVSGIATVPSNKLQRKARFRDAGAADFVATSISFVVGVALAFMGFGYQSLVWMFFLKVCLYTIFCWILEPVGFKPATLSLVHSIGKVAAANLFSNLFFTIYTTADTLIIGRFFGAESAGLYNTAFTLSQRPIDFVSGPIARTMLVAYSRANNDLKKVGSIYARSISASLLVLLPIYAAMAIYAKPLILVLVGSKFAGATPLLLVLLFYSSFRSVGALSGNVLVASQRAILNVQAWTLGFCVAGGLMWYQWSADIRTPVNTVIAISAGIVSTYIYNTTRAFLIFRPEGEDLQRLWKAIGVCALTAAGLLALSFAPLNSKGLLLIAFTVGPAAHAVLVGTFFVGSPFALLTKRGAKDLWKNL